jgi:hypothetical protein
MELDDGKCNHNIRGQIWPYWVLTTSNVHMRAVIAGFLHITMFYHTVLYVYMCIRVCGVSACVRVRWLRLCGGEGEWEGRAIPYVVHMSKHVHIADKR